MGKPAMKRKEAIDQLREIQEIADIEVAHRLADESYAGSCIPSVTRTSLRNTTKSASGSAANSGEVQHWLDEHR